MVNGNAEFFVLGFFYALNLMANGAAGFFQKYEDQIIAFKEGFVISVAGIQKAGGAVGIHLLPAFQIKDLMPCVIVVAQILRAVHDPDAGIFKCLRVSVGADILRPVFKLLIDICFVEFLQHCNTKQVIRGAIGAITLGNPDRHVTAGTGREGFFHAVMDEDDLIAIGISVKQIGFPALVGDDDGGRSIDQIGAGFSKVQLANGHAVAHHAGHCCSCHQQGDDSHCNADGQDPFFLFHILPLLSQSVIPRSVFSWNS